VLGDALGCSVVVAFVLGTSYWIRRPSRFAIRPWRGQRSSTAVLDTGGAWVVPTPAVINRGAVLSSMRLRHRGSGGAASVVGGRMIETPVPGDQGGRPGKIAHRRSTRHSLGAVAEVTPLSFPVQAPLSTALLLSAGRAVVMGGGPGPPRAPLRPTLGPLRPLSGDHQGLAIPGVPALVAQSTSAQGSHLAAILAEPRPKPERPVLFSAWLPGLGGVLPSWCCWQRRPRVIRVPGGDLTARSPWAYAGGPSSATWPSCGSRTPRSSREAAGPAFYGAVDQKAG